MQLAIALKRQSVLCNTILNLEVPHGSRTSFGQTCISGLISDIVRVACDLNNGTINPQEAQFEVENFWAGALREAAIEGKVHTGSLMAGQSVGLADKVMPIRDILAELIQDAEKELQRLHQVFHGQNTCT